MNSFKRLVKYTIIVYLILMAIVISIAKYKNRQHCDINFIGKTAVLTCPIQEFKIK